MYENYSYTFKIKNKGTLTLKINKSTIEGYTLVTKTEDIKGYEKPIISSMDVKAPIYAMKTFISLWGEIYSEREPRKDLLRDSCFFCFKDELLMYEIKFISSFSK